MFQNSKRMNAKMKKIKGQIKSRKKKLNWKEGESLLKRSE